MRVLIVEDEFIIAEEIASIVGGLGHTVVGPAGTIEEAVSIIADVPLDFAIVDANLRGRSSAELGDSLTERQVPYCVCTGYRLDDIRAAFGDIPVVQKPVRERALAAILESAPRNPAASPKA
jgi:DNA-binding NarL/FixJ family response regulator